VLTVASCAPSSPAPLSIEPPPVELPPAEGELDEHAMAVVTPSIHATQRVDPKSIHPQFPQAKTMAHVFSCGSRAAPARAFISSPRARVHSRVPSRNELGREGLRREQDSPEEVRPHFRIVLLHFDATQPLG
jgi:hypothetical protein